MNAFFFPVSHKGASHRILVVDVNNTKQHKLYVNNNHNSTDIQYTNSLYKNERYDFSSTLFKHTL